MKGKKLCIGLLILCITCLLSLNLYSNANAINFTENLTKVGSISSGNWKCYWKRSDNSNLIELSSPCTIPALNGADAAAITRQVVYLQSNNTIEVKKGHIYEVKLYTRITQSTTAIDYPIPVVWTVSASGAPQNLTLRQIDIDYEGHGTANSVTTFNNIPVTYQYYPQQSIVYSIFFEALSNGTAQFKVGRAESSQLFNLPPTPSSSLYVPAFQIAPNAAIFEYVSGNASDEAAEKELKDRDNIEEQSTTTDNQADNAGQNAENTGTTLMGAFTQLFTALSNVSGNNCTLPTMQVYSLNLGQMNLCTYTIPPQIMALVSIGMVFIIVPLGIHLVKKMISLYKEITG